MPENNTNNTKKKLSSPSVVSSTGVKFALAFALGVVLTAVIFYFGGVNSNDKDANSNSSTSSSQNIDSASYTEVTDRSELAILIDKINKMYERNAYIKLVDGPDEYDYSNVYYNKDREYVMLRPDNSFTSVGLNNYTSIIYTEDNTVSSGYDTDALSLLTSAVNIGMNDATGSIKVYKDAESSEEVTVYRIDITGRDQIKSLLSFVGNDDYVAERVDTLYESFSDSGIDGDVSMSFLYFISSDNSNDALDASLSYFVNDEYVTMWYFEGYMSTFEWDLLDDWYNLTINDSDDADRAILMLNSVLTDLATEQQDFMDTLSESLSGSSSDDSSTSVTE